MRQSSTNATPNEFVEEVELSGHIIDSLILPKVLDIITGLGGTFELKQISIGQARHHPSYAKIEIHASTAEQLNEILNEIYDHGARPTADHDCRLMAADVDGAFPEGFYSTTNQRTEVRLDGQWIEVADQEMDCGILVDPEHRTARARPMSEVRAGELYVVGHVGVRVFPLERDTDRRLSEFMGSAVSTEKPKNVAIREIARELHAQRKGPGRIMVVGGPAIVHTGSDARLCELIRRGYVDLLAAGNALATHDIEQAFFGTSLGVELSRGTPVDHGHEHHLRAINRVRRLGGIRAAVQQGVLTSGIMYECMKHNVQVLLAGSIRDDGPLPEVETDVLEAQRQLRRAIRDVSFCLMIATTLHSIAVGNLLPAWVKVVCVDINPSTIIKLSDRGSFQTVGLVTDVEPFLRALLEDLDELEKADRRSSGS